MANVLLYFGLENLALTNPQRNQLVAALALRGRAEGGASHLRLRQRVRADNQAVIFRALFDENDLSIVSIKGFLANVFGVDPATITHSTGVADFGAGTTQYITFTRTGVDYIRACVFGGLSASWEESKQEAKAYIALHSAEWT